VCVCSLSYPACSAHAPYWPVRLYGIFPHYLINGEIFGEKILKKDAYFHFPYKCCLKHFSFEGKMSQIWLKICILVLRKVPVILVRSKWNLHFLNRFSKNFQISHFMKRRPVGAQLFHAERRTDMTKLIVAFSNFTKAPKKKIHCCVSTATTVTRTWRNVTSYVNYFVQTTLQHIQNKNALRVAIQTAQ